MDFSGGSAALLRRGLLDDFFRYARTKSGAFPSLQRMAGKCRPETRRTRSRMRESDVAFTLDHPFGNLATVAIRNGSR
jgi:hypothetical protein